MGTILYKGYETTEGDSTRVHNLVYDPNALAWVSATGSLTAGGFVTVNNLSGLATSAKQDTIINGLQTLNSFVPSVYDTVNLTYTGDNLTGVVFKLGNTTISTLTLSYTGSVLDSVVKT